MGGTPLGMRQYNVLMIREGCGGRQGSAAAGRKRKVAKEDPLSSQLPSFAVNNASPQGVHSELSAEAASAPDTRTIGHARDVSKFSRRPRGGAFVTRRPEGGG